MCVCEKKYETYCALHMWKIGIIKILSMLELFLDKIEGIGDTDVGDTDIGDKAMLLTILFWWIDDDSSRRGWQNLYVDDFSLWIIDHQPLLTNMRNLSVTHFVSNIRHQHRCYLYEFIKINSDDMVKMFSCDLKYLE